MNAPFLRPRGCPVGLDPRRWREALAARIEWHQSALDRLIMALDRMDGDPDLEDDAADDDHPDNPVTLNPDRRSRDRRFYHPTRKLRIVHGGTGNDA